MAAKKTEADTPEADTATATASPLDRVTVEHKETGRVMTVTRRAFDAAPHPDRVNSGGYKARGWTIKDGK